MFFCKYNDPIYVKLEKLEIMIMLASDRNIDQVLLEFKEYDFFVIVWHHLYNCWSLVDMHKKLMLNLFVSRLELLVVVPLNLNAQQRNVCTYCLI